MKYSSFIIAAAVLGIFSGCEGNLQPDIYDKLTGDNFPATGRDAESLVNSVYYQFRAGEWDRYNSANDSRLVVGLLGTDEFTCHWDGYWGSPFNFTWRPDEFPFSKMYYDMMPAVTIATSAIAKLRKMDDVVDADLLNRYISEIRVARAYFMYDLYNLYGPVAVINDENETIDIDNPVYRPRPTREEMIRQIEADLTDEIIDRLEVTYPDSDYGRLTQGAARMCLLKLYLHEKNFPKVEEQARKIMALNVYDLEDNYADIWSIDNERNPEIIWALACAPSPEGVANNFRAHVLPSDWQSPNGYPAEGWNGYKVPWAFYDRFDPDDKRRECLVRYYTNKIGQTVDARDTYYGAIPLKYSEDPAGTGVNQGVDYVVYRYANVLLALAEALNEINGPNQESIDLINRVRERAFDPDKPLNLADYPTKEDLRDRILDELGFELYFEGNRREDLIRHGKYVEYANDPVRMGGPDSRPINPQQNARPYHVLYPIPNEVIVESGGVLKQNEGY